MEQFLGQRSKVKRQKSEIDFGHLTFDLQLPTFNITVIRIHQK